jgi:hypothetical protein
MKAIKEARFDHASTSGVLRLVRDAEGFSIREGLLYKPMGHERMRVLTLYKGRDKRLKDKAEALARFDMEVQAMGATYV